MSEMRGNVMSTGIKELDELLNGGFPEGYIVLVAGHPGAGKTTFAANFLYSGCINGEAGIYVSFAERKMEFLRHMKALGMDFGELERRGLFSFIEGFTIIREEGIEELLEFIVGILNKIDARRLVIDPIDALIRLIPESKARAFLHTTLFDIVKPARITTYLIAELPLGKEVIGYGFEEFVVDAVIKLTIKPYKRGLLRRSLILHKVREIPIPKYEYEFIIDKGGIILHRPLSSKELSGSIKSERISSGIKGLDEMLGGGFFRNSFIVVSGPSGTSKTVISLIFAQHSASIGEKVLYITFEESREQVELELRLLGYDVKMLKDHLIIKSISLELLTPERISYMYRRLIESYKPSIVIFDGASIVKRYYTEEDYFSFFTEIAQMNKNNNITTLITTIEDILHGERLEIDTLADTIIALSFNGTKEGIRRTISIIKHRGSWHDTRKREYVIRKGMVVIK